MRQTRLIWYDCKRRKPLLRIKILRLLGSIGILSIHEAERSLEGKHHHQEIWESFHALCKNELIKKIDIRRFHTGRKQKYYRLTEDGIFALIHEGLNPTNFWRATINYCHYAEKVDPDFIDLCYQEYLRDYLKFPSVINNNFYISQLDIFDHMCEKWMHDYVEDGKTSLSQKIFEILASHPNLTVQQISDKIDDSVENIDKELNKITRDTTFENGGFLIEDGEEYDTETLLDIMSDFMFHNTITKTSGQDGECTYSLSLYGVMLVVFIIRNHNANKIVKDMFVFNKSNIQQSLDIISNNYTAALPLIFGEWDLLKSILRIISVYNFDIIIYKKARLTVFETPSLLNGNKELHDAVWGIGLYSRKQLIDFVDSGISVYGSYKMELEKENEDTHYRIGLDKKKKNSEKVKEENIIKAIENKLNQIYVTIGYSIGNDRNQNNTEFQTPFKVKWNNAMTVSILQRAFANEITFLYFSNLNRSMTYIPDVLPAPDYFTESTIPPSKEQAEIFWSRIYDKYSLAPQRDHILPISLKQRLLDILTKSARIREYLIKSIDDCIRYHDQGREVMSSLSIEFSR